MFCKLFFLSIIFTLASVIALAPKHDNGLSVLNASGQLNCSLILVEFVLQCRQSLKQFKLAVCRLLRKCLFLFLFRCAKTFRKCKTNCYISRLMISKYLSFVKQQSCRPFSTLVCGVLKSNQVKTNKCV